MKSSENHKSLPAIYGILHQVKIMVNPFNNILLPVTMAKVPSLWIATHTWPAYVISTSIWMLLFEVELLCKTTKRFENHIAMHRLWQYSISKIKEAQSYFFLFTSMSHRSFVPIGPLSYGQEPYTGCCIVTL